MMQAIDVKLAKEYVLANYPLDPLLRQIALTLLDQLPKVETVEVIRCKDCKHCERDHTLDAGGDEYYYCTHDVMEHGQARANEFCSYGERRAK